MTFFSSSKNSDQTGEPKKAGLFSGLAKTRDNLFGGIGRLFSNEKLDESVFEEIEDQLLIADLGVAVTQKVIQRLREDSKTSKPESSTSLINGLRQVLLEIVSPCESEEFHFPSGRPGVVLMVGVNGVGKTTTLAKIASKYKNENRKVMLAACDTFRAAAIDQLQNWGQRLEVPVIAQSHGADAAAVAFDAYSAAQARGCDLLLVDTAGRQHTHNDLVEQLKKVKRVLAKANPEVPDQVWLTLDAGNGQNVLSQVEHFHRAVSVTGLCVTKLDGTAKGGIVIALAEKFGIPIKYIGVGEGAEDLRRFNASEYIDALLPDLN